MYAVTARKRWIRTQASGKEEEVCSLLEGTMMMVIGNSCVASAYVQRELARSSLKLNLKLNSMLNDQRRSTFNVQQPVLETTILTLLPPAVSA